MTIETKDQSPHEAQPFPLGRNVEHDSKSRAFPFVVRAEQPIVTKGWRRYGAVLDQGNVGACTGFAAAHAMNSRPNYVTGEGTLKNHHGLSIYSAATVLDEFAGAYPPEDTGSSGLGACKAMLAMSLITEYRWAFGFDHMLQALMHSPVMVGTWWWTGMFYPNLYGQVFPTGQREGGHEYLVSGVNVHTRMLTIQNSWGPYWGAKGRAYISFDNMRRLLLDDGDAVIPVGGPWS